MKFFLSIGMSHFHSVDDKEEIEQLAKLGFTFKKSDRKIRNNFIMMVENDRIEFEFKGLNTLVDFTKKHGEIILYLREVTL